MPNVYAVPDNLSLLTSINFIYMCIVNNHLSYCYNMMFAMLMSTISVFYVPAVSNQAIKEVDTLL